MSLHLLMVRYIFQLPLSHTLNLFSHPHFLVLSFNTHVILFFFKSKLTCSPCHDDISYPDLEYIINKNSHIFTLFSHLYMSVTFFQSESFPCKRMSLKCLTYISQISYDSYPFTNICYIQVPVNTVAAWIEI